MSQLRLLSLLAIAAVAAACGESTPANPDGGNQPPPDGGSNVTYALGGSTSGLEGNELVLRNGNDELTIRENGAFVFAVRLASGTAYDVQVQTQPAGQTCTVTNGQGTIGTTDVTNIQVTCGERTYSVGGTISGLASSVTLALNDGQTVTRDANGTFVFPTALAKGSNYTVTVKTQPVSPSQTCFVTNGTGTVGEENVTNVQVSCTTDEFIVRGSLSGLVGTGLVLQNNGGDDLSPTADGDFAFDTAVASGQAYAVTVLTQPSSPAQVCTVTNGSGTVGAGDVTDVEVACVLAKFPVGGTVTGLTGTLALSLDGESLSVTQDGAFSFPTSLESGAEYEVTIETQPVGQTCAITDGAGTVTDAAITTVVVTCATNTYALGGTLSGLTAGTVSVQLKGGDTLDLTATGPFTFTTPVAYGTEYEVEVATQPDGQTCSVTNGTGTMPAAAVTGVTVNCSPKQYTVGGTVTGLEGEVVLQLNEATSTTVTEDGAFVFQATVPFGFWYSVTVLTQPSSPPQTCTVAQGEGSMGAAPVTNIVVTCETSRYAVGGTVTGLEGTGLKLVNNGGDELTVSGSTFTFATPVVSGQGYAVTVSQQPSSPTQDCVVTNGTGTVAGQAITSVEITCTTSEFTVGGTVSGLDGTLVLQTNGQDATLTNNDPFTFAQALDSGTNYEVSVKAQPVGQTCEVTRASGTVTSAAVTDVVVTCTSNQYLVGGTLSGLVQGTSLTLRINAGETTTLDANGAFSFPTKLAYKTAYTVQIATQPEGQTCELTAATGEVAAEDVASIDVACTKNAYTLGGTISGLVGSSQVTLELATSGVPVTVSSGNGPFTFAGTFTYGLDYTASVTTSAGHTCTVTPSGAQTVPGANVTTIAVACEPIEYDVNVSVTGLSGTLGLQLNGAETASRTESGAFAFATKVAFGSTYQVAITSAPESQTCTVSPASATEMTTAPTNVTVSCVTKTYAVGGEVSGLVGDATVTLTLESDGNSYPLAGQDNGAFAFETELAHGSSFTVTATNPAGHTCAVTQSTSAANLTSNVIDVLVTCTPQSYAVGGGVLHLVSGTSVKLHLAAGAIAEDVTVTSTGDTSTAFAFLETAEFGTAYVVTIAEQPEGQTCTLTGGASGSVSTTSDVAVEVTCSPKSYTIGGGVSGLLSGNSVVLQINGSDDQTVTAAVGTFGFTGQSYAASYTITVATQPTGQTCKFANDTTTYTATVPANDVSDIALACSTNAYSIGGTVTGLPTGTSVLLQLVADSTQSVSSESGSFTFTTALPYRTGYTVAVETQPVGYVCTVTPNDAQTVPAENVTTIAVSCEVSSATFTVGGTISGLTGTVVLQLNGANDLSRSVDGAFTFDAELADAATFEVTVLTQPDDQLCTVTKGAGTISGEDVDDVAVDCVAAHTVGGKVGLGTGTSVSLKLNDGTEQTLTANGDFTLDAKVGEGSAYAVTVSATEPSNLVCHVYNGTGTATGDVTDLFVSCDDDLVAVVRTLASASGSTTAYVDEFSVSNGTKLRTVTLPFAVDGSNLPCTLNAGGSAEGSLMRSENGKYVVLGCYSSAAGGSTSSGTRTIARIDATGTPDTSTRLATGLGGSGKLRGVASADGTGFWAAGDGGGGGVWYQAFGATTGEVQVSTTISNARWPGVFGGQLYVSSASGSYAGINKVGTGLPIDTGNVATRLSAGSNAYGFAVFDTNGEEGPDLYYMTADSGAGLSRYVSNDNGTNWTVSTWTTASSPSVPTMRGFAATKLADGTYRLVGVTTSGSNNHVLKVYIDNGSGSLTEVSHSMPAAGSTFAYRGVAFSAQP